MAEQDRKIEEYAVKKDTLDQVKKDREEQKFREKQLTRQKLIEKQAAILMSMQSREDEILNKQVGDAEVKAFKIFEEQEKRRVILKEQIVESRTLQIQKKQNILKAEQQENVEFKHFWKLRSEELHIAEHQEKEEQQLRNAEMRGYLER